MKKRKEVIRKVKKQVKGITLIALVVTIIVLLILAGVAMNLTIGSNGIFTRTQQAVEEYSKKQKEEEVNMYWGEAQLNYKDTIEEQVEYLQNKMREQDSSATAVINGDVIDVVYKGHSMELSYIEEKIPYKIKFIDSVRLDNKILNYYVTLDNKIYSEIDGNTICITDNFNELKNEKDLTIIGTGSHDDKNYISCFTKKKVYSLWIPETGTEEWTLETNIDLENLEDGKYKDKNISYYFPLQENVFFDDGTMYSTDTKQEGTLENAIINMGIIMENGNIQIIFIDDKGQMNKATENGLESINDTFANGFFKDKKVIISTAIIVGNKNYIAFGTDEGKVYLMDINNNEIICLNDLNEELRNKKIVNIYIIGNGKFVENYIAIVLEEGVVYYANQDLQELININVHGFPELHTQVS